MSEPPLPTIPEGEVRSFDLAYPELPVPSGVGSGSNPSGAGTESPVPTDGEPPETTPNPPLIPAGGGCRSSISGPASCNWAVPVPAAPQPEVPDPEDPEFPEIPDIPEFPMPGDDFDDMPVVETNLPNFPKLPCLMPDFGNMDPCGRGKGSGGPKPGGASSGGTGNGANGKGPGGGAGPAFNGPLPGGRDRMGRRGDGMAGVKTAGKTYGAPRSMTFAETTCPGQETPGISCMAVITQLLMDTGIEAIDIIFQVGVEWDKDFPADKCFAKGSRIFDAAEWTARFIMCIIVDEGPPTNNVYIGPPWHRPGQTTWTFNEHYDLFNLTRDFSGDEVSYAVSVFGPNVTTPILSVVDSPFAQPTGEVTLIEVGANYSQEDAESLAAFRASEVRREAVSIQATVPYSSEYFLRDLMVLEAPDKGFQETYVITAKEFDVSPAGWLHVLTGMLPATLAELDAFPEVTDEFDAVEGGFA